MKPSDWLRSYSVPTFPFHDNIQDKALKESKDKEKIFAKHIFVRGLVSKIYKELLNSTIFFFKSAKGMNRHLTKKLLHIMSLGNSHMNEIPLHTH